jgi:beta-galactosidase/beta-glucuronidase
VSTPYSWNEDDAFRKSIAELSTGVAWYRKHFKLPSIAPAGKSFWSLKASGTGANFYLNGKFIGRHENGVMLLAFDISDQC